MKQFIFKTSLLIAVFTLITACNNDTNENNNDLEAITMDYQCPMKCEGEKIYHEQGTCPVCNMNLKEINSEDEKIIADPNEISSASIFNLTSKWQTQDDETIELKDLKGDVLVMVMIYTTCKAACPRLVADMRDIQKKVNKEGVKYVLISIDPETDTPERLKEFSIENEMDGEEWIFLNGKVDDVREFSNVLSVKYKQISPLDFSHSNIISIFDKTGVLYHQQEGLGIDNSETVTKILEL